MPSSQFNIRLGVGAGLAAISLISQALLQGASYTYEQGEGPGPRLQEEQQARTQAERGQQEAEPKEQQGAATATTGAAATSHVSQRPHIILLH